MVWQQLRTLVMPVLLELGGRVECCEKKGRGFVIRLWLVQRWAVGKFALQGSKWSLSGEGKWWSQRMD